MAQFKWQGNSNLTIIASKLQQTMPQLVEEAQTIVQETVLQGQQQQIQALERAVTKTGIERQEKFGGQSGRDLTGHMINEIDSDMTTSGNNVKGGWGWNDPEQYFLQQDDGFEKIPAANSLRTSMEGDTAGFGSFVNLREEFFARVIDMTRGE
jgi:hypothetical protein